MGGQRVKHTHEVQRASSQARKQHSEVTLLVRPVQLIVGRQATTKWPLVAHRAIYFSHVYTFPATCEDPYP